jgi:hypothetical protein
MATKGTEGQQPAASQPKIMTKPLPQILDEIEDSIRLANEAAADARAAAEEARRAGEQAAKEAARVAAEAIGRVEDTAKRALALAELLKLAMLDATAAVEKRLSGK